MADLPTLRADSDVSRKAVMDPDNRIIVIGASAGGVEALLRLVPQLPGSPNPLGLPQKPDPFGLNRPKG